MAVVTMRQLLESGVHFGHQTRRWNPQDEALHHDRAQWHLHHRPSSSRSPTSTAPTSSSRRPSPRWHHPVRRHQEAGPGADRRAGDPRRDALCQPPLARWHAHQLPDDLQAPHAPQGAWRRSTTTTCRQRLHQEGTAHPQRASATAGEDPRRYPHDGQGASAVWIVDTKKEHLAVDEAKQLRLPVIAILDTNCDPDEVDFTRSRQRRRHPPGHPADPRGRRRRRRRFGPRSGASKTEGDAQTRR